MTFEQEREAYDRNARFQQRVQEHMQRLAETGRTDMPQLLADAINAAHDEEQQQQIEHHGPPELIYELEDE
jgi:hypothetical protein